MTKQDPPTKRWLNGKGYRTQQKFYRAIEKYGWENFEHEILYQCEDAHEAEEKEKFYIEQYKSQNNKYGYNISPGGLYNTEITEETLEKSRKSRARPEYQAWLQEMNRKRWSKPEEHKKASERFSGKNNPQYGKKQSQERKDKAREKFMPYVNSLKKKVICVETGEIFDSAAEAERANGLGPCSVSGSCRKAGKRKFLKKALHWEYYDDYVAHGGSDWDICST